MQVWRYELGTWVEEDLPLSERHPFLPEGYDHSPFVALGDTNPGAKEMSAAAHEASEGGGYFVVVLQGRRRCRLEQRINIYATMLWVAVLAIGLFRAQEEAQ